MSFNTPPAFPQGVPESRPPVTTGQEPAAPPLSLPHLIARPPLEARPAPAAESGGQAQVVSDLMRRVVRFEPRVSDDEAVPEAAAADDQPNATSTANTNPAEADAPPPPGTSGNQPPAPPHTPDVPTPGAGDPEEPEPEPDRRVISPVQAGMERAMAYVHDAGPGAFGRLFVAVGKQENIHEDALPPDGDSLHDFDRPTTEASKLRMEHQLAVMPDEEALTEVGLKLGDDPFIPGLEITDSKVLIETLRQIPDENTSDTLGTGLTEIARLATFKAMNLYPDTPLPGAPDPDEQAPADMLSPALPPSVSHVLGHAPQLMTQFERLGADPEVTADLRRAHMADKEGLLDQWARARYLDLYKPPTTDSLDRRWTQWGPPSDWNEWPVLDNIIDDLNILSEPDSPFVRDFTDQVISNLNKVRTGDLAPSHRDLNPIPQTEVDDDYDPIDFDKLASRAPDPDWVVEQNEAYEREYHAKLDEVEQRLRALRDRRAHNS